MIETGTLLIGGGPIGLEVAAALKRAGAEYEHLEAGCIGNTLASWPRNTVFFSSPEWIAIAGGTAAQRASGERSPRAGPGAPRRLPRGGALAGKLFVLPAELPGPAHLLGGEPILSLGKTL